MWLSFNFTAPHVFVGSLDDTIVAEVTSDYGKRETKLEIISQEFGGTALDAPGIKFKGSLTDWFELQVVLPAWFMLLITAGPTAWLWHRDRRRIRPGCCLRCGYDLTGNTSGVCSECGRAKPPPATV